MFLHTFECKRCVLRIIMEVFAQFEKNETTTNVTLVTLVNGSQMLKTIPHAMENSKLANSAKLSLMPFQILD